MKLSSTIITHITNTCLQIRLLGDLPVHVSGLKRGSDSVDGNRHTFGVEEVSFFFGMDLNERDGPLFHAR